MDQKDIDKNLTSAGAASLEKGFFKGQTLGGARLRPMATSFLMGFTCGVPLVVVITLLQAWLKDGGLDLRTIGFLTLVSMPYSLKFLWSPYLDFIAPFGRRRQSWLLVSQLALIASLLALSMVDPQNITQVTIFALSVSFWSATQDIAVDAYRREDFFYAELAAGSAAYMWGYRLGMVAVAGGGLVLADWLGWRLAFTCVAGLIVVGPLTLLFSPEPKVPAGSPKTLQASVVEPLKDFFAKSDPWLLLAFILFYKLGEQLIGSLNTTFFMAAGYSKTQIGVIVKAYGLTGTLAGISFAGYLVKKKGLIPCLWTFGWLQLLNNACLTALWLLPAENYWLATFITLDHMVVGAGSTVFVAFLASLTNVSYTATQYALLTSLMALPRSLLSSPSGVLVELLGWPSFYLLGAFLTLPGLAMLKILIRRGLSAPDEEFPADLTQSDSPQSQEANEGPPVTLTLVKAPPSDPNKPVFPAPFPFEPKPNLTKVTMTEAPLEDDDPPKPPTLP
ncbi:MAG: MFS transporter [Deltaproteobacteria bacterium]|jgi:PAT family beta-lactamase induction signal transducer AmpG|nr:MFS transporter [Deltaproteobacteria bacterium]